MMPPGGAPPAGGGGGDLAAQLMQLIQSPAAQQIMSSPKGQQMAQAIMSQMGGGSGGDPRAMMAQMGAGGGRNPLMGQSGSDIPNGPGPVTDGGLTDMVNATEQMRPDLPPQPRDGYTGGPSTEEELAMVQNEMGAGGKGVPNTGGMNSDGPTPEEIKLLQSSPSPRNVANFEKLFGPGSAQQYLGGGGAAPPPSGGSTYEQDVQGAMDDSDGDEGDHEYR